MSERLQNVITAVVAVCALVVTGLVVRREVFARPAGQAPPAEVRTVQGWQALARVGNPMGAARPRVNVVEFSDFQCPFCAQAAMDLKQLRRR
jgi:protein-disulfide isomerase